MSDRDAVGTVDFFNDTGGYGFIETPETDEDVFFHMEDIGGPDLEEGQEVAFDIELADKGPRAKNVVRDSTSPDDSSKSSAIENVKELVPPLFDSSSAQPSDYDPANYDAVGTVDFYNDTGRYGFIKTPDVEEDVFVHMEDVDCPDLEEGTTVALDVEFAEKGPRATSLLHDPPSALQDAIRGQADQAGATKVFESGAETDQEGPTEVFKSGTETDETDGTEPTKVFKSETATTTDRCSECQTEPPEGANFCPECGATLSS